MNKLNLDREMKRLPKRQLKCGDVCGIDGGAHRWSFKSFIKMVDRGTCDCGAVCYQPNQIGYEAYTAAALYDEKHGRPGKEFKGVIPADILNRKLQTEAKKEEIMVAQINEKELHPETREKLGITPEMKQALAHSEPLPPIPPKPDLTGLKRFPARRALGKYYMEHDAEMLEDYRRLGDRDARQRWGCSGCLWVKFRRAHGLTVLEHSGGRKKKPAAVLATPPPPDKATAPEKENVKMLTPEEHAKDLKTTSAAETPSSPAGVITYTIKLDTEQLDKDLAATREKFLNLNALRLSLLPRFRWWWLPSVQKKYLEVLKELLAK